ncbi:MAG: bifunctional DNA-formamidopyrimidine glycosylase/DNA-(apurinic or apyrimidinic site) lyase [Chloroflexi bacterium]|nr:bifunctional DNA-formamidopyrimidine glycosylase/DNA-(apurinic or apyrimidinic site) lyase [Chloroflexota bacterium]
MPELPEVETIKNDLLPFITGRRFTMVEIFWNKAVHNQTPEEFTKELQGQRIKQVNRRGKYLIFQLSKTVLIIHLRMSGSLLLRPNTSPPDRFTTAIFYLDNNTQLRFCDTRKLGKLYLVADENSVIGKLGPEPLDKDFTVKALTKRLSARSSPIKAVLIDQTVIAGIGNMYADEILFAAGIHPMRKANSLSVKTLRRLHKSIKDILAAAISCRGASVRDYKDASGKPGTAQLTFKVAHRLKEMCNTCGTPLKRIVISSRGTYFCPGCQPLK